MKAYRNLVLGVAVAGFLSGPVLAADKDQPPRTEPGKEEVMKKVEEAGRPGPAHRAMQPLVGSWEVNARCFNGPGGTPMESQGTSTVRWIMGERFLQEEFKGEFMGKSFQGLGLFGYDNVKQKYVSTWLDDMTTTIFVSEGTADADGKVFTFEGKMSDPMTGEKEKPTRCIVKVTDQNKHTFEMIDLSGGKETKMMEMTYTRRAANERAAR
jgi:hypothetical protein